MWMDLCASLSCKKWVAKKWVADFHVMMLVGVEYNINSICIVVQKNHAKPLWNKGAKHIIGLFYICKWYNKSPKVFKTLGDYVFNAHGAIIE